MNVKKCVRALLCLYLTLIIAMDAVKAQTLKVGDTLPPEIWSMPLQVINHPTGKETLTLSEYRDKLIILDFWATWCAPCIKSLTKLDTLQREFKEQLAVVPITYENADKVLPFLTKRGYQLPSVINDSTLKKYFPHRSIPHQVWVKAGEVLATTGISEYLTKATIAQTLKGKDLALLSTASDVKLDGGLPLFYEGNGGGIEHTRMRSVFSKRIPADVAGIFYNKNNIRLYNIPFKSLAYEMYSSVIPFGGRNNHFVWEIKDSLKNSFEGGSQKPVGIYEKDVAFYRWLDEFRYCYELSIDTTLKLSRSEFLEFMKDDVNRYFKLEYGVEAVVEERDIEAYVIIKRGQNITIDTALIEGGYCLQNQPLTRLAGHMAAVLANQPYPVINTLGEDVRVTTCIGQKETTPKKMAAALNRIGLDMILTRHKVKVIVIKYTKSNL